MQMLALIFFQKQLFFNLYTFMLPCVSSICIYLCLCVCVCVYMCVLGGGGGGKQLS